MSRLLAALNDKDFDTAEDKCAELLKMFEGYTNTIAGTSLALAVEFLIRNELFDLDDFLQTMNKVAEFRDEHDLGGGSVNTYSGKRALA